MKKTLGLFLVLFVVIQQLVYAQTGIGTNSPNDQAVLEIQSVDKGVLFPSISLTSTTTFLGGISATASHTNMLVYNTNTATTTTGLDGAGYYFWNGSNWEKITGDTDGQSLAEVTAIGSSTFDVIQVGGIFDIGDLTVNGESSLQGDVRLGVSTGQTVTVNGLVDTNILFFGPGRDIASTATPVTNVYGQYIKPGSGNDLDLDTNDSSNRITFSNDTNIKAGVNSSTLFVGDDAGPNHYKFPSGTASRSPDQVLSLDSSSEQLTFISLLRLPTATNDGATLRWDTTGNEWQESTDLRIAPNSSSEVWINQSLLPSSTLLDIGQSGNNFDEVYADQFLSSQTSSITFGTNNGSNKVYLKFEGDSNGSMVLNDKTAMGGNYNTVFGYRNFTLTGTTGNNNVAIGFEVLNNGSTGTGDDNVGVGYGALSYNTGSNNVAVGSQALENNTAGVQNLALGSRALDANTQGQYNVAVGYNSLTENTLGEDNIAIGKQSMESNTIGDKNIVIGTNADVGTNNLENAIAIGYNSTVNASNTIRLGNTDIESIVSSGTLTLDGVTYPNNTGTAGQVLTVSSTTNILYFTDAVGSSSTPTLDQVTDVGSSTSNGIEIGELIVDGDTTLGDASSDTVSFTARLSSNIVPSTNKVFTLGATGRQFDKVFTETVESATETLTLKVKDFSLNLKLNFDDEKLQLTNYGNAVAGITNFGFGINALYPSSDSNFTENVAIGHRVLNNTSMGAASRNLVLGLESMNSVTTGSNNLSIGIGSASNITTGDDNISIGNNVSSPLRTGSDNVIIGNSSYGSAAASSTNNNVGIGNSALNGGNNNVAIGHRALEAAAGDNNVAIGYQAGNLPSFTGSNNTLIGNGADVSSSSITNGTAIGNGAIVSLNNSMRLGNSAMNRIDTGATIYSRALDTGTGTVTTENLTVGVPSTNDYNFPSTRGLPGQTLTVSTTSNQLVFSSPAYFLGDMGGSPSIDLSKLSSSPPFEEVGDFQLVETDSSETITITTQNEDDDTFKLPAGKSFKLTSYISFDSPSTSLQYRFYNHTESKMIGLEGFVSVNNYVVPAVAFVEASSSDVEISIVVINAGASSGNETVDNDFTRIEIVEIK